MKKTGIYALAAILAIAFSWLGIDSDELDIFEYFNKYFSRYENFTKRKEGELEVNIVDVGQGDCIVTILPDNKILMIDSGDNGHENEVFEFLDSKNITTIDYLVATHPHSDHIGSMPEVIEKYEIVNFYMPKAIHTSSTYKKMIENLQKKSLKINTARAGKTFIDESGVTARFIAPVEESYEDLNYYSAVIRLDFGETSFLFTADMEEPNENELLEYDKNSLDADVLKVAHHGSSTSSTKKFLDAVSPEYSVISCGKNNDYNHPHREILERLENLDTEVYRTDTHGTVTFVSDGDDIRVNTVN